ncbi:MAG: hypothetical protein J5507_01180 [Clostridia bacterium]|nr:hypothetical protein [Clostridia bacterium]
MAKNKRERRISKNEKRATKNEKRMRLAIINAQAQKEAEEAIFDAETIAPKVQGEIEKETPSERTTEEVASATTNTEIEEEENKKSVEEIWEEICTMVGTLNKTRKETLFETWNYVKNKELKERTSVGLTETDEQIMGMIEAEVRRLAAERDEDYFREVEYVTRFDYLMENALFAQARLGHSSRKFKSLDNFKRYCDLRSEIERIGDEDLAIKILLDDPKTDEVTKRILAARRENMVQYKRRREGFSTQEGR